MIDYASIEDVEDVDGESLHAFCQDAETGEWAWRWIDLEVLAEHRPDIVASVQPEMDDDER